MIVLANIMFNFMKKGVAVASGVAGSSTVNEREKVERDEKRKRSKKVRKESKNTFNISGSMSTEELLRLDEVSMETLKP